MPLHLEAARAFGAPGVARGDDARATLEAALAQLGRRRDRIGNAAVRSAFLVEVPEHAALLVLAHEHGVAATL